MKTLIKPLLTLAILTFTQTGFAQLSQASIDLMTKAAQQGDVIAQNNLGVVLMERGKLGEARAVFQQAFALDSGQTDSIRENLKLAIARTETDVYSDTEDGPQEPKYNLMRRGTGEYVLLTQL